VSAIKKALEKAGWNLLMAAGRGEAMEALNYPASLVVSECVRSPLFTDLPSSRQGSISLLSTHVQRADLVHYSRLPRKISPAPTLVVDAETPQVDTKDE
jgi:hypothetical protein